MNSGRGLGQRLWRVFILQASIISVAAILGVFAARFILGDVLIKRAMQDEADFFWEQHARAPGFARPMTHNLSGYLSGADPVPKAISAYGPGFHTLNHPGSDLFIVYVTEKFDRRLYLIFDGEHVGELAIFFGLFPLAGVLIVLYLSSWIAYRFSSRAVSPILKLAQNIAELDPSKDDISAIIKRALPQNPDQEIRILTDALLGLSARIEAFVLRERNFTRDTSHELRTPITVIKIAAEMLRTEGHLNEKEMASVERIGRSATDMEELIEALLLLARESESALSFDPVCVNDVVREECERASIVYSEKAIDIDIIAPEPLVILASDKVLSALIGNIIRNAWSYTDRGNVRIEVQDAILRVRDSGTGIPEQDIENVFKPFNRAGNKHRGGYGVGLTIVKMLSDRFHWPITIESELQKGTTISIDFSGSRKDGPSQNFHMGSTLYSQQ